MDCKYAYELINDYVDGAIDRAGRARVENHVLSCVECASTLRVQTEIAHMLNTMERESPSASFSDRVIATLQAQGRIADPAVVAATAPPRPAWFSRPVFGVPVVAFVLLLVAVAMFPATIQPLTQVAGKSAVVLVDGVTEIQNTTSTTFGAEGSTFTKSVQTLKTILMAALSLLFSAGEFLMFPALALILALSLGVYGYIRGMHRRSAHHAIYSF